MKTLFLCTPRGFCAGVVRAIDTVKAALNQWGAPIYVKHEIVHNRHVVDELKYQGAIFVEDLDLVPEGSRIIYSAHGVSPKVREHAKKRNLIEIDATCGLVTKVHSAAKRYAEKGYHIILIGHKNHVEVIGTYGEAPEATTIVENVTDVEKLIFSSDQKLVYLTQTTLSIDDLQCIITSLEEKFPQIITLPSSSICYATTNRQRALQQIVQQVDLALVVGDPMSSNSKRLREIAENRNVPSYLITDEHQIQPQWIHRVKTICMTAGASTPDHIVKRCIEHLQRLGIEKIEEVFYTKEDVTFSLPKSVLPVLC